MSLQSFVLKHAPIFVQNAAISVYNWNQWRVRRKGIYAERFAFFDACKQWDHERLCEYQKDRLGKFLDFAVKESSWYSRHGGMVSDLSSFPFLSKVQLVDNFDEIATIESSDGIVSYTGGTTGASMKVHYTIADTQERFAMLDWFRSQYGWDLGKKTAWFSGKNLLRPKDLASGCVWRDDWITRTRFFSTFDITPATFESYWNGLLKFRPEFIVGFPSSVCQILKMAQDRGLSYPGSVKAFFPTAETVLPEQRRLVLEMLGAQTVNQYASSEGAPFILECPKGQLHIHPLSGVFEVVDSDGSAATSGDMVVTSFTTHGTPLIRYQIGDRMTLAAKHVACSCGWNFPIVSSIEGRTADFVWSPQKGKVNLGNLSNSTKGVPGIVAFQVIQKLPDQITVLVQPGRSFDRASEQKLIASLRERVGGDMQISVVTTDKIAVEKSGKFRIVHNHLDLESLEMEAVGRTDQ